MGFYTKLAWLPMLLLMVTAGACSLLGSGTAPDDMSVEGHRREAQKHAEEAREHKGHFDSEFRIDPGRDGTGGRWGPDYDYRKSGTNYWVGSSYNPSERHLTHAKEHEAHAQKHRRAARSLEVFEEAQCGAFPPETRVLCPLLGQLDSVENIPSGSRIRFADGVDVDAAVAHMRCHIAFARSHSRVGMDNCPLYLEVVRVSRVGPGSEADFLVVGTNELKVLRERMRRHVAPESP